MKYSKKQIEEAKRLYATGISIHKIAKIVGFESIMPVRWHCNLEYRKKHIANIYRWRLNNKKRYLEIQAAAYKNLYAKKYGKGKN